MCLQQTFIRKRRRKICFFSWPGWRERGEEAATFLKNERKKFSRLVLLRTNILVRTYRDELESAREWPIFRRRRVFVWVLALPRMNLCPFCICTFISLVFLSVCLSVMLELCCQTHPTLNIMRKTPREKRGKKTGEKRRFSLALFLPVSLPHILRTHTTTRSLLLGENERKEDGRNSLKKISSSGGSSNNAVVLLRNSHHFYYGLKLWIEFIHRETDRPTEAHFLESSFASCIFSTFLFWVHYGVESNPGKHEMV